jgi:hypothetical protein
LITGYNTDVKHGGKVFHVQTEDKGVKNPIIETLVYVGGGQIIASRQYSYAGLVSGAAVDEIAVAELLESQHKRIIRWITGGKFDPQGPPAFGATIISQRSFDEVVLEWLGTQVSSEPIEIVSADGMSAVAGQPMDYWILVRGEASNTPIPGAQITITLAPAEGAPVKLVTSESGPDGTVAGILEVPLAAAGGTLLLEARHENHADCVEVAVAVA